MKDLKQIALASSQDGKVSLEVTNKLIDLAFTGGQLDQLTGKILKNRKLEETKKCLTTT